MINKQIVDYVQKSIEGGFSVEQISASLSGQGWSSEEINGALLKAQEIIWQKSVPPIVPPKKPESTVEREGLSVSEILLYLGGLIVILAGIIYIGINWSQWGPAMRIFAIFAPMLICYVSGALMFSSEEHKNQSIVFLTVGSLLFPFFLSITFKELNLFAQPLSDNFCLIVSLLSFVLYFASSFVFRSPIWAFLCHSVGLFIYYFFLRVLGVDGFDEAVMSWLFLIPGTLYLFLSLFYEKNEQKTEGYFSYMIGEFVLILSFLRLFGETFVVNKEYLSYFLIIFGVAYFLLGIFYEKSNFKKYCHVPYFIGAGLVFLFLSRLAIGGKLLEDFIGSTAKYDQNIVGWSNVIVGTIYLIIGWAVEKLKNFQLEVASKYKNLFNLVGPLWILGAIFYLGLNGKKPAYETLLLISSLGFIFGSIPKVSRKFLYIGTLFLIVYIFSMGGEYFQNDVGWPITLFVAGLISMGIGVAIEGIKRKYFTAV
jgi:uncharacterized membrane protein